MNRIATSLPHRVDTDVHPRTRRFIAAMLAEMMIIAILLGGGGVVHRATSHSTDFGMHAAPTGTESSLPAENAPLPRSVDVTCHFCASVGSGFAFGRYAPSWVPETVTLTCAHTAAAQRANVPDVAFAQSPRAPPHSLLT